MHSYSLQCDWVSEMADLIGVDTRRKPWQFEVRVIWEARMSGRVHDDDDA